MRMILSRRSWPASRRSLASRGEKAKIDDAKGHGLQWRRVVFVKGAVDKYRLVKGYLGQEPTLRRVRVRSKGGSLANAAFAPVDAGLGSVFPGHCTSRVHGLVSGRKGMARALGARTSNAPSIPVGYNVLTGFGHNWLPGALTRGAKERAGPCPGLERLCVMPLQDAGAGMIDDELECSVGWIGGRRSLRSARVNGELPGRVPVESRRCPAFRPALELDGKSLPMFSVIRAAALWIDSPAIYTGMRRGEIFTQRRERVDLDAGLFRVEEPRRGSCWTCRSRASLGRSSRDAGRRARPSTRTWEAPKTWGTIDDTAEQELSRVSPEHH